MTLEGRGEAARFVGFMTKGNQGLLAERDGGAKGLALEGLDAEGHELVGVAAIDGAGGDLDVGEMPADELGNGENAVTTGNRDDDHLRLGRTSGAQHIEAATVTVEHFYTEALDQLNLRGVVVDQRHRVALGAQQPGDDLAEA